MYDGNVAVYNLQANPNVPIYESTGMVGKHKDAIWEVRLNKALLLFLLYLCLLYR